ncbi:E3 ubiquitin-protein ligase TRIM71-like [Montipora capricornis]|uniref:E3 ubiquitin-protein ligase TRIM71-like n=1 Tax=Montipora capricornis TaxID=246305 RepID=UPI0035F12375
MDIPKLLFNLREEASCPVCQDILRDPRYRPCLHSICLNCLINWHRASGGQVDLRCPKCQVRCRLPASGDLKDLPASFFLSGFIDALTIRESDKMQVTCGNCDKKTYKTSYCFECCKFYCDECLIGHNIIRNYKDHRVLAVKDFQEKDYEIVVKRPVFCSRKGHEKEELKFFCNICPEDSVCKTCCILDHAGHKVTLIQEEAEAQKIELAGLTQTPKRTLKAKIKMVTQIDEEYAQLVQRSEDMLRDVDVFVDNLMRRLQEERQKIKSAVDNETKKSLESLTTKKTAIQEEIKRIELALEKAEKLLTRSTDAEVVQLKKPLQTILKRVGRVQPVEHDPESLFELVFVENNKILETINSGGIGLLFRNATDASESVAEGKGLCEGTVGRYAQFNLTTRNAAAEQCYNMNDNVTVDLRDDRGQECITTFLVFNDNKDGAYKVSYPPTLEGKYKLSVKSGDYLIVSDCGDHSVKVFTREGDYEYQFGKTGKGNGEFNFPYCLSVSKSGHVFVCDHFNHRVQVFDLNGQFVCKFGKEGSNLGEFKYPVSVALLSNGQIVVSDNENHRIQIFDEP